MKDRLERIHDFVNSRIKDIYECIDFYGDSKHNFPLPYSRFKITKYHDGLIDFNTDYSPESPYSDYGKLPDYVKTFLYLNHYNHFTKNPDKPHSSKFKNVPVFLVALCMYEMTQEYVPKFMLNDLIFEYLL